MATNRYIRSRLMVAFKHTTACMGLARVNRGFEPVVKSMTYQIDTCRFIALYSALLGDAKDWLVQCQENVTEWDIRSWC